ncbi:adenylosuccinate synthetase [Desulfosediminicola sp.]|uniref:adenylosuccinate synthetase n=1 Tax=Desulfosediminicola sp. TaxID=2886825 RepID=UPI003AF3026E
MPVSIVVGGQFGSEGKGKVAHYLAKEMEASFAVRCGGPNSGHTVIDPTGKARIFQQLPTASILPNVKLAICSGSYIDLKILLQEIQETGVDASRLIIDPDAVIITDELKQREAQSGIIQSIGSTGSGTGAAVVARILRKEPLQFAKDIEELTPFIQNVPDILRDSLNKDERVIIEGTQGFGLSPLHARHYPFTTSRDTTAAAFLAETGLSPFDVDDIVLTIRTFPIRVSGNSGPLAQEIDWQTITKESGNTEQLEEKTSVSKKTRRVARFTPEIVKAAILINQPTRIVLNHIDYITADIINNRKPVVEFIRLVEMQLTRKIALLGDSQSNIMNASEIL